MRWPSFSSLKSSSTGTPGYGEPPRVKISHSRTPKDHLKDRCSGRGVPFPAYQPEEAADTHTSLWWV